MIEDILHQIEIQASPETVFTAWTTPEQMVAWWGDEGNHHLTAWTGDVRKGGKWHAEGIKSTGQPFSIIGEYLRVEPPKHLSFTWKHDWEENSDTTIVELEIQPKGKGTLLKLKHHGFQKQESRDGHNEGWGRVLSWLQRYMDQKSKVGASNK